MFRFKDRMPPDWIVDSEDLGNVFGRARIQSCNACVSTSLALCVWPCNCYEKGNKKEPDLMWDLDLYARLELADAWAIIGPVNWYAPSSNLKLLFDRLVCASGANPYEELIEHKNPELAMQLEKSPLWNELSQNHLEGRTAGFFCYGDGGGDELDEKGRPKILNNKSVFNPDEEPFDEMRSAYAPLVWQCRYSGIEVPDSLWAYAETGFGKPYADDQAEHMVDDGNFMAQFDSWAERFKEHISTKDSVPPSPYPAAGHKPPGHRWADLKLLWREYRMKLGLPPTGSSPAKQQERELNRDTLMN